MLRLLMLSLLCSATAISTASDLYLFRGEFIYIVPEVLSEEMSAHAARGDWQHFPEHTRRVDLDDDGEDDLLVAAFASSSGYAAQVRYRLLRASDGSAKLGRWFWGAVIAPDRKRLIEEFNP